MAKNKLFLAVEMEDGTDVSFTIDKEDVSLPDFGLMYTVRKATNPNEERTIIIPWHRIKQVVVDQNLEEVKDGLK